MHLENFHFYFAIILILVGVFAGFSAGLFGMGGGIVLVPAFLTLFPFFGATGSGVVHGAIGTALALIVPTAVMSSLRHYRLHHIDFNFVKRWLPVVVVGAIVGSLIIGFVSPRAIKIIFTIYLYFAFIYTALKPSSTLEQNDYPRSFTIYLVAPIIGGLSILLGMGGGTFTVPFLRLFNYRFLSAIGISAITTLVIGFIGTIGAIFHGIHVPGRVPGSIGFVNVMSFILITPFVMWLAPKGASATHYLSLRAVKWLYSGFLFILCVYMTYVTVAGN